MNNYIIVQVINPDAKPLKHFQTIFIFVCIFLLLWRQINQHCWAT